MKKNRVIAFLSALLLVISMTFPVVSFAKESQDNNSIITSKQNNKMITPAERKAATEKFKKKYLPFMDNLSMTANELVKDGNGYLIPDYFGSANWAYSPPLRKFIDSLPGLGVENQNALGQYIPVAIPDTWSYPGSDYYEIAVVQYSEQMHSDLPPTMNRGYVQLSTSVVPGKREALTVDGMKPILLPNGNQAYGVDKPHYLGPAIIAESDKPVRIKFYNLLPIGAEGNLFIPVDTTIMGAGVGYSKVGNKVIAENFTQNRANIHLHGNNTVWISDGTPHQWITPANETTSYPQGVSVIDVPDMEDVSNPRDGATTLYYTNAHSARLMFYHDHSYGITRLNVYAGEAAAYILSDQVEKDLINGTNVSGVNPGQLKVLPDLGIPLVIQDRTFVDADTITETDPTWTWGTKPGSPNTGDLWYPHVYSPAQNPWDPTGVNPFGRWMYGPWFWPPTEIQYGPMPNPYYDPVNAPWQPPEIPSTPNPSAPGESFMDTPIVNGTAYPYLEVEPKAYRFRVLNAANDRFFNLQMYVADPNGYSIPDTDYGTEVKMIPANGVKGIPADWPSGIPDPSLSGPDWIQIGTEGGFLPAPVVIPNQPITWNLNATTFNAGNVDKHSLLLGTAERADVIVDFSNYAGKTIILYNDAPAPFPALDPRYDYYTNNEDLTSEGGAPSTQAGYGPNTRTIMQIRVADSTPADQYDITALKEVFKKTNEKRGVFEVSQEPIIVPQEAYNSAYNVTNLPSSPSRAFIQLHEFSKTFQPINSEGILQQAVTLPLEPKALQDEMGEVFDEYGRMSGYLGLMTPISSSRLSPFIPYGYASPPVDILKGIEDLDATLIGSQDDGTQIWKITHNGVDTHTIHTHLFAAQLVNRVAWDGMMIKPDPNELGYKETFRVNPLEHTVIALRPKVPSPSQIPFDVPNSVRLLDPTLLEGEPLMLPPPAGWFDPAGNSLNQILNHKVNFGWEYVYHCHILSHEEMDMMHTMSVVVRPKAPNGLTLTQTGNGNNKSNILRWQDNSKNETMFTVERSTTNNGPWTTLANLPANSTTYTDRIGNTNQAYFYRVYASNTVGDTVTPGFPSVTMKSAFSNIASGITLPLAPTGLTASLQQGQRVQLTWRDNAVNETHFVIERSVNGGSFIQLTTVGANNNTGNVSYTDASVIPGNSYNYRVAAVNAVGQSNYSNTASVTLPNTLPLAPTGLTATLQQGQGVLLTWRDNAVNETYFAIERSVNGGNFAQLATVGVNNNTGNVSYTDVSAIPGNSYIYRVAAVNTVGKSNYSNTASLTLPNTLPLAPTGLTATLQQDQGVLLTWRDNADSETHFVIERSANGGNFDQLVTVGANNNTVNVSYIDTSVIPGNSYSYRVAAVNAVGQSDYSNEASIALLAQVPLAPTGLTVKLQQSQQVVLDWKDNADNETGFRIERSENGDGFTYLITVGANKNTGNVSYTDTTVVPGNSYIYRVAAENEFGLSDYTNEASITLPATQPPELPPTSPSYMTAAGVRVGNGNNDRITLNWNDNSDNETGFIIELATDSEFTLNLLRTTVKANTITYQTGNLPRGVLYYIRICAVNNSGQSDWIFADPFPVTTP